MALRAGYKGFKKLISPLILNRPGTIGIDGDALNAELNEVFFPRSEQAVLGAVNQLNTTLSVLKTLNTTGTWEGNVYTISGVSFTVGADGSLTITGQATALVYFDLNTDLNTTKYSGWILNGFPSDGSATTFRYRICASPDNRAEIQDFNMASGEPISDNGTGKCLCIRIANGYNPNGLVIKPMISFDGGAFLPYAMTNRELTEKILAMPPKTGTFSGSTSANGNIKISDTPKFIIAVNCAYCADTYIYSGVQYLHFTDAASTYTIPAEGTTVSGTYLYYDIPVPDNRELQAASPDTREASTPAERTIEDEPVTVKKTTRKKSTAAAETEKEGE